MDVSESQGVGDGRAQKTDAGRRAQDRSTRLLLSDLTCSMRRRSTYTAEGDDAPDGAHAALLDETGPSAPLAHAEGPFLAGGAVGSHAPSLWPRTRYQNKTL